MFIIHSKLSYLILNILFKSLFFFTNPSLIVISYSRHDIPNSTCRWQQCYITSIHCFPHEFIVKVPIGIHYSVVCLDVGEETFVVEYTAYCAIKSMYTRIILVKLLTSKCLPKPYSLSLWILSKHPCMRPFTISTNAHIGIHAETQEEIAKQNCMIFGISTALKIRILRDKFLLLLKRIALSAILQLFQLQELQVFRKESN